MTEWTPKLERLIRGLGEYEEKQAIDGSNPNLPVWLSALRVIFRSVTDGGPYREVCKEMEVESGLGTPDYNASYKRNIQMMIDLARANGSDAADVLERTRAFWSEVETKYPGKGGLERITAVHNHGLRYRP